MYFLARNITGAALLAAILLLAGCGVSEQAAQRLVDESIAQALTAVPTVTPQPTSTPVTFPPTATPQPTSTPLPPAALARLFPTPTPVVVNPTATPRPSSNSGPGVASTQSIQLGDGLTLVMDPGQPVTGRPVRFQLSGLSPWQPFTATFLNPVNGPADWTRDDQVFVVDQSGQRIRTETLYADGGGRAAWTRWNALDTEGQWTVRLAANNKTYDGRYVLTPLQLATVSSTDLGITMRRYSGTSSEIYLSAGVPASVALDLSGQLPALTAQLESWLLLSSAQIPNVYFFSNNNLFRQAVNATGVTGVSPFATGIYRPSGRYRGVYVTLNEFSTATMQTLVHEQAHLLVEEVAPTAQIPAWLNEGLATYLENHIGPDFGAGFAPQRETYKRADDVKASLSAGALIPLSRLVSQQEWNSQANEDLFSLQYSEAYMAVRYLTQQYGDQSVGLILRELERGKPFDASLATVTGVTLAQFERDWTGWLGRWQDPSREQVRQYVAQVESILAEVEAISEDRGAFLNSAAGAGPFAQRVPTQTQLVNRAAALTGRGNALAYPGQYGDFHQELLAFLSVFQGWLQKELDAFTTGNNSFINQANALIPEVGARQFSLHRRINSIRLNYWLEE
ncbi:MAG TPA: hypothetical protein VI855_00865 [Dehalococcoidia bacterium]|nr:hypothetical protein [Dehalococcoidia bacterium]